MFLASSCVPRRAGPGAAADGILLFAAPDPKAAHKLKSAPRGLRLRFIELIHLRDCFRLDRATYGPAHLLNVQCNQLDRQQP